MRILLTGAGGPAAISVWKSLKSAHEFFMADIDPCATGLYLVPAEQRILLPRGGAPDFTDLVFELCQKHKIELLLPTVDVELDVLAAASHKFLDNGIKLPLSSVESLKICRDKYLLLNHCKNSVPLPKYTLLTEETTFTSNQFPLFAKPRFGSGSRGVMTVENSQDLSSLPRDGSYLIQELLPGAEYSVDVYIHSSGRPLACVPRLRMKVDSGVAVAAQTQKLPDLEAMALAVAKTVDIRYVANIQFKADAAGQFKLLEINPRFPGTLPLTAAAGVDIPKLLIKDITGETLPAGLLPFEELMVVRYWTEHFCCPKEWEELCQKQKFG